MKASEYYRDKVKHGIERLANLKKMEAPDIVIIRDIIMIHNWAKIAFGSNFYEELHRMETDANLRSGGWCVNCQKEQDLVNDDYCSKCSRELDREFGSDNEMN